MSAGVESRRGADPADVPFHQGTTRPVTERAARGADARDRRVGAGRPGEGRTLAEGDEFPGGWLAVGESRLRAYRVNWWVKWQNHPPVSSALARAAALSMKPILQKGIEANQRQPPA